MSWDGYIASLMAENAVADAAIFCRESGSRWASNEGGFLSKATMEEVLQMFSGKQADLFANGFEFGGMKCTMIRDRCGEKVPCVDAISKDDKKIGICFAQSVKTIVVVAGSPNGRDSGNLNKACAKIAEHLAEAGY